MVNAHDMDDTDDRADLTNPVNHAVHRAAERMLCEFPYQFHLNLDRNASCGFKDAMVILVEQTIAAMAKLHGCPKFEIEQDKLQAQIRAINLGDITIEEVETDILDVACFIGARLSVYVVLGYKVAGKVAAIEIAMELEN